ncbi:SDR family NAD(P)-dependent oxidoreductase [Actinoallomurus sp. NPDC052308]|uniref:SDR family NAD(P)-dependent oxidoreductase n=1 Tax=Actinoallomurus sp. NPDC052308 TaxID=3155530 RepID=UPI00344502A0
MSARKTTVVVGVGPGLGMSIAHRFGREGHAVALISRSDRRHAGYVSALAEAGIEVESFVADVRDRDQILSALDAVAERFDRIDVLYYGPAATDLRTPPEPIVGMDTASVREAMAAVYSAVDVVGKVLPGMIERGDGGLLFAGGLSAVTPMPALGALALSSAALRNYALTLNTALVEKGVYAGSLIIGGLIERGDIHEMVESQRDRFGDVGIRSLDPDEIADTAWTLYSRRDRPEATFNAFG